MMDLATIRQLSREAAVRAAIENEQPFIIEKEDIEDAKRGDFNSIQFPFIGDYVPKGWHLVQTYFVDSSGLGKPGERALTKMEFARRWRAGYGYAVVEAGRLQVHIGEFEQVKEPANARRRTA